MDFNLTEEQLMIRESVREFAQKEVAPRAIEMDRNGEIPLELIQKMARMGFLGIPIPEEYGGEGGSFLSYIIAIEELSRACASTGVTVETHTSLGTEPILNWGTEEQKKKYLPRLASGEMIGSFALTEPNAGSDAGGLETVAVEEEDCWVLNGSKIFISNSGLADLCIVMAMTDKSKGTKGISAFIVETSTPGFIIGKQEDKMGIRASKTAALTFEDCRVPKENLLGKPGEGFKIALHSLDGGRVAIAAQALGIAKCAYDRALEYAKERVQFGKPIASFQAIQMMLAEMATEIQAARMLTYHAAWLKDQGERITKEAAMAKYYASSVAMKQSTNAVQIFGGYGYIRENGVERLMRDAKITEIYEGTNEIQKIVIAGQILR
ncbi:MAG TPA: acyl-CoA dehydrogenase [Bacillota bacterium]|nr:acyl-CoA dehydrogenase [Bacillota bacterium]